MTKTIQIEGNKAFAEGPLSDEEWLNVRKIEGKKSWIDDESLRFEPTPFNLSLFPSRIVAGEGGSDGKGAESAEGERSGSLAVGAFEGFSSPTLGEPREEQRGVSGRSVAAEADPAEGVLEGPEFDVSTFTEHPRYRSAVMLDGDGNELKRYPHQLEAVHKARTRRNLALFAKVGRGKSKAATDIILERFVDGRSDQAIAVMKKNLLWQWAHEEFPKQAGTVDGKPVDFVAWHWGEKEPKRKPGQFRLFCVNYDMIRTKRGWAAVEKFLGEGRTDVLFDESHQIKNKASQRWKAANKLRERCDFAMMMTGTPTARDLLDEWSQFYALDWKIVGVKYKTSFQQEYCVMGGFRGKQVIGHRNVERFNRKIAPYTVYGGAATSGIEEAYRKIIFELSDEQRAIIKRLKDDMEGLTFNNEFEEKATAMSFFVRVQQITSGYIPATEEGPMVVLDENPRLDALEELKEELPGPLIVWCRFVADTHMVASRFGSKALRVAGDVSDAECQEAVQMFKKGELDVLAYSMMKGTEGMNLQGKDRSQAFYSHTNDSLIRWQAEGRLPRPGASGYLGKFDLVARASPDVKIMQNLKTKQSFADFKMSGLIEAISDV